MHQPQTSGAAVKPQEISVLCCHGGPGACRMLLVWLWRDQDPFVAWGNWADGQLMGGGSKEQSSGESGAYAPSKYCPAQGRRALGSADGGKCAGMVQLCQSHKWDWPSEGAGKELQLL